MMERMLLAKHGFELTTASDGAGHRQRREGTAGSHSHDVVMRGWAAEALRRLRQNEEPAPFRDHGHDARRSGGVDFGRRTDYVTKPIDSLDLIQDPAASATRTP
jgi:DNA-binding response OmpR family regulator